MGRCHIIVKNCSAGRDAATKCNRMDSGLQLRLFPAPKPLVERLGVEFFQRVPDAPGVYLMADEFEHLLYVGKAKSLRARLNSYSRSAGLPRDRRVRRAACHF